METVGIGRGLQTTVVLIHATTSPLASRGSLGKGNSGRLDSSCVTQALLRRADR